MPPTRSAALSARIAVLGIVVREGGPVTLGDVALRFAEDFGAAQFARSAVHQNLQSLTRHRRLRLVSEGAEPSYNVYEALERGVAEFEQWLLASEADPPALRDATQARLSFYARSAEHGDVERLVENVRVHRQRCARQFALAHGRVRLEQTNQRAGPARPSDLLCLIRMEDEAELWGKESERYRRLLARLLSLLGVGEDRDG